MAIKWESFTCRLNSDLPSLALRVSRQVDQPLWSSVYSSIKYEGKQHSVHRDLMRVNWHSVYAMLIKSLAHSMLINIVSNHSAIILLSFHYPPPLIIHQIYYGTEWLNNFMTLLTFNQNSYTTVVLK